MPTWIRVILGAGGIWCGFKAFKFFALGIIGKGILLGLCAFFLVCFAIWGIRRTCRATLEGLDLTTSTDLLGAALEGIAHGVGALFEGL